ncbi:hypothetical protein KC19_VG063400, partial [Ceratodon purpureus]
LVPLSQHSHSCKLHGSGSAAVTCSFKMLAVLRTRFLPGGEAPAGEQGRGVGDGGRSGDGEVRELREWRWRCGFETRVRGFGNKPHFPPRVGFCSNASSVLRPRG